MQDHIFRGLKIIFEKKKIWISMLVSIFSLLLAGWGVKAYVHDYESKASALLGMKKSEEVVAQYPRSASARIAGIQLGHDALEKGDYVTAIRYYQGVLEYSPPDFFYVSASQNLALAHFKKGEFDPSARILEKILEDPKNKMKPYTHLLLAQTYTAQGSMEKAKIVYKTLSEDSSISFVRQFAQEKLKEFEK